MILTSAGIVLGLVIVLFALRHGTSSPEEVEVASATLMSRAQASAVLTASGYVVAKQKASIASKGTGRLVSLAVEEGDPVREGQVIARLEDQDVTAALERAVADLAVARADSAEARLALARQRTLFEANLASSAEMEAAASRMQRVEALILAARAAVRSAEVQVENTRIRAPFDGTVLTKDADVGEVVAPFASSANSRGTVVTIAAMSSLEVEADVSESNIMRVSVGQPCEITLDAYPDQRYPGVVHKIVPTADRSKATVLTRVRFRKLDERVLPEMSAKVSFPPRDRQPDAGEEPPQLTIPASALVTREGNDIVLLVRGTSLTETPVKSGERYGTRIEITEGLQAGDRVVARPTPAMRTGTTVKVRQ